MFNTFSFANNLIFLTYYLIPIVNTKDVQSVEYAWIQSYF